VTLTLLHSPSHSNGEGGSYGDDGGFIALFMETKPRKDSHNTSGRPPLTELLSAGSGYQ
jgi:hypothetical protein